jgi:hypothetical protein
VRGYRERQAGDRRHDLEPHAARLQREAEARAEESGEQGVAGKAEERVAPAELHAPVRGTELGVGLCDV